MTTLAFRFSEDHQESFLLVKCNKNESASSIVFKESTKFVDGIGGFAWNGSLMMCHLLQSLNISSSIACERKKLHVHEIGCGSAVPSILLAANIGNDTDEIKHLTISSSDREIDLADLNIKLVSKQICRKMRNKAFPLDWGCEMSEKAILDFGGVVDILIGCEIACLRLQQENLMNSINQLVGPESLLFISFDGEPPSPSTADNLCDVKWASIGEREMHTKFIELGYSRLIIFTGRIIWESQSKIEGEHLRPLQNIMSQFYHGEEFRGFADTIVNMRDAHLIDSSISNHPQHGTDPASSDAFEVIFNEDTLSMLKITKAVLHDETLCYENDISSIVLPFKTDSTDVFDSCTDLCWACSHLTSSSWQSGKRQDSVDVATSDIANTDLQHICLYYLPKAISVCKNCEKNYFRVLT